MRSLNEKMDFLARSISNLLSDLTNSAAERSSPIRADDRVIYVNFNNMQKQRERERERV